nr:phospholipase [Ramlibacter sp.]
ARVWAAAAGAQAVESRSRQRGKRYPMTVTDFKLGSSTVSTLVDIEKLGHAWSGGAANQPHSDAKGPDASRMLWAFAAREFAKTAAVGA